MIIYFPEPLPDETMYSILSRYRIENGCLTSSQVKEELFVNQNEKLDFLFINKIKPEIKKYLCNNKSWDDFLKEHTLLTYYGRFIPKEQKQIAYKALYDMTGNYANTFRIPQNRKDNKYLRYCPMCVNMNRNKYGKTYWSRIHQITEVNVCPIHGCRLINSSVSRYSHDTRLFTSAEEVINDMSIIMGNETEIEIAKYIYNVIESEYTVEESIELEGFFNSQIYKNNSEYISNGGGHVNTHKLASDLFEYYKTLKVGIYVERQITEILHGKKYNPFEIIQLALFFKIEPSELIRGEYSKSAKDMFEERVINLMQSGMSMYKIARKLNVSDALIHIVANKNNVKSNYTKYANKKRIDKVQRKIESRKIWLEAIEKYPTLCYSNLRKMPEYHLAFVWLRANDKEWTDEHFPVYRRKGKQHNQTI
ncbi:MAG: TnsD family transposase [Lachnospiraceae bacterium]|nr:TnsD family transposase [Lachnospiraceae bacterium]